MVETWVCYWYQGGLGESESLPNAYSVQTPSASSPLSLREVLAYFPAPSTENLMFRVKTPDEQHGYIWYDVDDDAAPLPRMKSGEVFLKVLRIDEDNVQKRKASLKRKEKVQMQTSIPSAYTAKTAPPPRLDRQNSDLVDMRTSSYESTRAPQPIAEAKETSMLDFSEAPSQQAEAPDLVDFGSFVQASPSPSVRSQQSSPSTPAVSLSREELVQKRLDEVKDRVNSALEFKHELDDNLKREAEELEVAKAKHDQRLNVLYSAIPLSLLSSSALTTVYRCGLIMARRRGMCGVCCLRCM